VIKNLLKSQPTNPFNILAVTRNPDSKSAQKLAENSNVSILQGDFNDCDAMFKNAGPVWGVFSVQLVGKEEENQGKAMVDAAAAHGVNHFVYTSVDRGGPQKSEDNPTYVPHFASKYEIEKQLLTKAAASPQKMNWTILRPAAFFDNMVPGMQTKVFAATWGTLGDKKLQLIACQDIGFFAAEAFRNPGKFSGQSISLAGDELTLEDAQKIFKEEMGYDMPVTYGFVGSAVRWAVKEMGVMFKWFGEYGYGANIPELRKMNPDLQDFRKWLKESSGFAQGM